MDIFYHYSHNLNGAIYDHYWTMIFQNNTAYFANTHDSLVITFISIITFKNKLKSTIIIK